MRFRKNDRVLVYGTLPGVIQEEPVTSDYGLDRWEYYVVLDKDTVTVYNEDVRSAWFYGYALTPEGEGNDE